MKPLPSSSSSSVPTHVQSSPAECSGQWRGRRQHCYSTDTDRERCWVAFSWPRRIDSKVLRHLQKWHEPCRHSPKTDNLVSFHKPVSRKLMSGAWNWLDRPTLWAALTKTFMQWTQMMAMMANPMLPNISPAFLMATGRVKMPMPMLPLRMWVIVSKFL